MSENPADDGVDDGSDPTDRDGSDPTDRDGSDPTDRDGSDPTDPDRSGPGDDPPAFRGDPDVPGIPPDRDPADPSGGPFTDPNVVDDVPTVSCSRCDREWDLEYELDELAAGNRALEQFAMDHERHTGHYPDGVRPWHADCRHCPDGNRFLAERPARRFARTHARHTGHAVDLSKPDEDVSETLHGPSSGE